MPHMDGLAFIEAAQKADPGLGYVVLSAFDSDVNLRRTIPLQVYEFIPKPLPERSGFEDLIPEWIDRTRRRRREHGLAQKADVIAHDLDTARMEREVEIVASETARDALLQSASLLTTIHAHLVAAASVLGTRARTDPTLGNLARGLEEARKTADAAITVSEGFFDSAYGSRDSSPALIDPGLRHAADIAVRMCHADSKNKQVDLARIDDRLPLRGLTGIDFLLMMVPAIGAALAVADANTTVRVTGEHVHRLDSAPNDSRFRQHVWINRRNAVISQPGCLITVAVGATPFSRPQAEAWLQGEYAPLAIVTARGLVLGVQKCKGLLGLAVSPAAAQFSLVLALPF
jgi:hypothetical protein